MTKVRLFGVFAAVVGLVMGSLGVIGLREDIGALTAQLPPGLAVFFAGAVMIATPGTTEMERFDFTDWFDRMPLRERIRFYVAAGLGFAIGGIILLVASDGDLVSLFV